MRFVEAGGVSTHVAEWGKQDGPDVFLIHGASSDMDVFRPSVIPLLKDRYHLAAYDRPGLGFTAKRPADADTLKVQADVAADAIRRLELKKPVVLAHSWGGAVALRLALDHPDLVGGLVLIAPVAYDWPGGVSWHLYWSASPVAGPLFNNVVTRPFAEGAVKSGIVGTFAPMKPTEAYLEEASVMRAVQPRIMKANALDMVAAKREVTAQQARYGEIRVPVAIMAGDGDTVVSPTIHSAQLAKTLPDARLEILPGVGHVPQESAQAKLGELVDWVVARRGN